MGIITTTGLTKDYGHGKGIFDVNIDVQEGEVFGFLGPNGAGKTTTIRNLMGFIRPDRGSCTIQGMDCFTCADKIQSRLGYLAGEIAFLEDVSGMQLLNFIADMKGLRDRSRVKELMEQFELDPRGKVRKMSKGMKQKIGIISAFMSNPDVIILDEPTSGLDPLMQNRFVDLVISEKQKGKTILMSSHIFEEVERTCDRTAIIRNGKIAAIENMEELSKKKKKTCVITLKNKDEVNRLKQEHFKITEENELALTIEPTESLSEFFSKISKYDIKDFDLKKQSLEEIFMHYYGKGEA